MSFVREPPRIARQQPEVPVSPVEGAVAEVVPEGAAIIPNVGLNVDQAVVSSTLEGQSVLQSFVPSWKNAIIPSLRKQGLSEKEIGSLLDLHLNNMTRKMESLLDNEFLAVKNSSELQFGDCI